MLKHRFKKVSSRKIIVWVSLLLVFSLSLFSLARFYANSSNPNLVASGNVVGEYVYINDENADLNYYESLKYTKVTDKNVLPTYSDDIFDRLVKVTLTYNGQDINNSSLEGDVSATESSSIFVYNKYYPVKNGKIEIELIDNPYTKRPNLYGFNGWVCDSGAYDCSNITMFFDSQYYTRKMIVSVDDSVHSININLKASWTKADITSDISEVNNFNDKSMQPLLTPIRENHKNLLATPRFNAEKLAHASNSVYILKYLVDGELIGKNYYISNAANVNTANFIDEYPISGVSSSNNSGRTCANSNGCYVFLPITEAQLDSSYIGSYFFYKASTTQFRYLEGILEYETINDEIVGWNGGFQNGENAGGYFYKITNFDSSTHDEKLYYNENGVRCDIASTPCSSVAYKLVQKNETMTETYQLLADEQWLDTEAECTTPVGVWKTCQVRSPVYDGDGYAVKDGSGNIVYQTREVVVNHGESYYYLVTRDTNIFVATSDIHLIDLWCSRVSGPSCASPITKPYTVTSNYYNDINPSIRIYTDTNDFLSARNDLVIENIYYDGIDPSTISNTSKNRIYSNGNNIKIGRNVIAKNDGYYFANSVVGGDNNKVIVESGIYGQLNVLKTRIEESYETVTSISMPNDNHTVAVYGSDYDRVSMIDSVTGVEGDNTRLIVINQAVGDTGNVSFATSDDYVDPTSEMIVKSGTFGSTAIDEPDSSKYAYGIYVGSYGTLSDINDSYRTLKVEGGRIFNINGGLGVSSTYNGNAIGIYVTGGTIDNIVGGSGIVRNYGNRIVSVTGGTVKNAVVGGSNSYNNGSNSGPLYASTLVYIGGDAYLGDNTSTYSNLYGVLQNGSVFGAGLGNNTNSELGVVESSNVIINGGYINGDVYGGGNYGSVGTVTSNKNTGVNITLLDGTILGSVYGGANEGDSGYIYDYYLNSATPDEENPTYAHNINIELNGSSIDGNIYGGSNSSGSIYGNVSVLLKKGNINEVIDASLELYSGVYAGGKGKDTVVYGNTAITTNVSVDSDLKVAEIYGGSENGKVNGEVTIKGNTTIYIDGGEIMAIFGGGKGSESYAPESHGNISLTVNKGQVSNVFGGNNVNGQTSQTANVIIQGTSVVNNVYGGSKGENATSNNTGVTVSGGTITGAVYGGGKASPTNGTSHVTINGGKFYSFDAANNVVNPANIYGGGEQATVSNTIVTIEAGADVFNVFGGSNLSGIVVNSTVNCNGGEVHGNVYGGGYLASVNVSNVNLNGTEFKYNLPTGVDSIDAVYGNAFGGGNNANVGTSNVILNGSKLINVYGGSNTDQTVSTSNVLLKNGETSNVFGGNNAGGQTTNSSVTINEQDGTLTVDNVFAGSNGSLASITEDTHLYMIKGTITNDIFGGGNNAPVYGKAYVDVYGGVVRNVFGGGNRSTVGVSSPGAAMSDTMSTRVNVVSGTVTKNVYGSGNFSFIYGDAEVNIGDSAIRKVTGMVPTGVDLATLSKVITIQGSVFNGSESTDSGTTTFDYTFEGVKGDADMYIDGTSYGDNLKIVGSIFGSGNNSIIAGIYNVYINKVGTVNNPMASTSIQRVKFAYITDSYLELTGAVDRTNQNPYRYSLIRIDNLYSLGSQSVGTLNGTELYIRSGATFLQNYYSGTMNGTIAVGNFIPQETRKVGNDLVNSNSNNKIYNYTNKVLAISNAEEPGYGNDAGKVVGMSFLGMYIHPAGGSIIKGIYDSNLRTNDVVSDDVDTAIDKTAYTFVYGIHYADQTYAIQKETNGFYSNYIDSSTDTITVKFVEMEPRNAEYYKWSIGDEPTVINVDLVASKYSVNGTVNKTIDVNELKFEGEDGHLYDWKDAIINIESVSTDSFGAFVPYVNESYPIELVDKSQISTFNTDDLDGNGIVDANQKFALAMGTTSSGWLNNYKTNLYSGNNYAGFGENVCESTNSGCVGDNVYNYDSTTNQRSLTFWLYFSKNLDFSVVDNDGGDISVDLGYVSVATTFTNPHADPTDVNKTRPVQIVINISMFNSDDDNYGKAISSGKKYEVFSSQTGATNIAVDGSVSIYQSVSINTNESSLDADQIYNQPYTIGSDNFSASYRVLKSSYNFPVGTIITMLDLADSDQYYYEVKNSDYNSRVGDSEYKYKLSDFIRMGNKGTTIKYDNSSLGTNSKYYFRDASGLSNDYMFEEFIFTVDFSKVAPVDRLTSIDSFYLYMELVRDMNGVEHDVVLRPGGIPIDEMVYTIYPDVNSSLTTTGGFVDETGSLSENTTIYVGESADLELTTKLIQKDSLGNILNNVSDTTFDDYKLGAKITFERAKLDADGNYICSTGAATCDDSEIEYEAVTDDLESMDDSLFGTVITVNGRHYYPQKDGSTRLLLAGRITEVVSNIELDFSNSSMVSNKYRLNVETFISYDGLYYADIALSVNNVYYFELLNNQYGLDVSLDPSQMHHDVKNGQDKDGNNELVYTISTKAGVSNPNIKVTLQRRSYVDSNYFDTTYENVELSNIASELYFNGGTDNKINSCAITDDADRCIYYNLGNISKSLTGDEYEVRLVLKDGPDAIDLADKAASKWKSGTYRVIFTMFDGTKEIGSVYEYLIIRDLNIDEAF